jgi:hypothetical protein
MNWVANSNVYATWLPWNFFVIDGDGLISSIRCIVCSKVESRKKLLIPKPDYLLKHLRRRKTIFAMPRVKVGEFYENKKCAHSKKRFCLPNSLLILFSNLLLIKVWLLTKEKLSNLLSFCMCYLIVDSWQILKIWSLFLNCWKLNIVQKNTSLIL